jgi:aubergine-like protein
MAGRARGRARGRGQGEGAVAPAPGLVAAADPPPPALAAPVGGNGRAAQRGGMAAGDPRPGGVSGLEAGVGAMRMGGEGGDRREGGRDRGRRRGGPETFTVTRPAGLQDKRGTCEPNQEVSLVTNYFRMETAPDFHLYQYHVSFQPEIISKGLRSILVREQSHLIGKVKAFDGTVLFLPIRLPNDETEVTAQKKDETIVKIKFALTNVLPPSSYMCLHVYNIIFRRVLKLIEMQQIGRNYFNPKQAVAIKQHGLEIWPGFATSILNYETSVLLMCDVSHKILRINTVLDDLYDIRNQARGNFKEEAMKKLLGQIILTRYNNKTYKVDDIDFESNVQSRFERSDKSTVSYVEYYKEHYQIDIRDKAQPMLVSMPKKSDIRRGQTKPIYLVPELCTLTGLSEEVRADFRVMKDVAEFTRVGPAGRTKTVQDLINVINSNEGVKQEMSGWGVRFASSLLQLSGHVLKQETVSMNKRPLQFDPVEADWTRGMRGNQLTNAVSINNWILIFSPRDAQSAEEFFGCLTKVGPPMGVRISPPVVVALQNDQTAAFLQAMKENKTEQTQLILCVLPSNRKDRYDAIKKFCCVDSPVPSQVVLSRTLAKKQGMMSVATKVAIQLNCKLGGEAWTLDIPLKGLMVVGIDSYHDSAKKGQSVGALVASMNASLTKYYSRCLFQHTHQELLDGLKICLQAALRQYYNVNGAAPAKIIIYRDGVGDGQLDTVIQHEVPQLFETFKSIGTDYKPQVAFVIVKKRLNTRFFRTHNGQQHSNPPPGTVVDTEVTRPEWYDFFLVSQSVRQGTVAPTHYNVVYDTTGLKVDHMQKLAYKLTHLYYNWPGTIRVPAPCQYAHKLAFLVGQSLHKDPSLALADKLFYL